MARVEMTRRWVLPLVAAMVIGCVKTSGDGGGDGDSMGMGGEPTGMGGVAMGESALEIRGTYTDNWDGGHALTVEAWTQAGEMPSVTRFSEVDNGGRYAVGQNASDHPYNPNLWSRFDWTFGATGLFYCQTAYDAVDEATALAADGADADDLETGCNANPWSQLTPTASPELAGNYTDGFSPHLIEGDRWRMGEGEMTSQFILTTVDNEADFAIARNDDGNEFSPGLWSRFEWIGNGEGTFFYCQATYDAPTADAAHGATVDRAAPETGGCGMFGWSTLTAP